MSFSERFNEKYAVVEVTYQAWVSETFTLAIPKDADIDQWIRQDVNDWDFRTAMDESGEIACGEHQILENYVEGDDIGNIVNLEEDELSELEE